MPIVWSVGAKSDLAQIWNYLAREAPVARADDQIRKIETARRHLSEFPLIGQSRDKIVPGLRTIVTAPYVIFYRNRVAAVEVIRVLDGRRDIDVILAGMP